MNSVLLKSSRRRYFIGGSDARIIMGDDEEALLRLWREKRGEVEPKDLSGNLIVQLGVVTEDLNRRWYEANTGQVITEVQQHIRHPVLRWMAATLDGRIEGSETVFEAKFMLPWSFSEEAAVTKYMPSITDIQRHLRHPSRTFVFLALIGFVLPKIILVRRIVPTPTLDRTAKSIADHRSIARAARIWALEIFFVLGPLLRATFASKRTSPSQNRAARRESIAKLVAGASLPQRFFFTSHTPTSPASFSVNPMPAFSNVFCILSTVSKLPFTTPLLCSIR